MPLQTPESRKTLWNLLSQKNFLRQPGRRQTAIIKIFVKVAIMVFLVVEAITGAGKAGWAGFAGRARAAGEQIYWGGYLDGDQYGYGDAPWDTRTIDMFEQHAGKGVSIIHWGQFWHWSSQAGYPGIGDGFFQKFDTALYERVRQHGSIPMINWNSWAGEAGGSPNQPAYQLIDIINGAYDDYIRQWARDARAWGKPFFLRFDHEMNGTWYPWSEVTNGNQPGQYVQAWRHVHDLFSQEGANNVTWVWSVNTEYANPYSGNLEGLYPGDAYVDWVAIDGYNWGTNPAKPDSWKSFAQVMSQTYNHIGQVAPTKPIMLSEFASTEYGGSKASWITDALGTQLPNQFPRIQAIVWFNFNAYEGSGRMDWVIESSSSAQSAFASGIGSAYYAANSFAAINSSPIPPLAPLPAPTATPAGNPTTTPTPAGTLTPIPTGANLLLNPSYEASGSAWLSPWNLVVGSGAAGSVSQDGNTSADGSYSAKVNVTTAAPNAPWGVQMRQKNLVLLAGVDTSVRFWAKASSARSLDVVIQMGVSPYTVYHRETVALTTTWQEFSFSYTQPTADTNAMLAFNAAQSLGQVWVDNASIAIAGGVIPPTATPTQNPATTATPAGGTATPVVGTTTPIAATATPVAETATPVPATATPASTPTAIAPGNLVLNPSFEANGNSWLMPWVIVNSNGASGKVIQDGTTQSDGSYSAKVNVIKASSASPWGVQVQQKGFNLSAGSQVTVSFWAKASSTREIAVVVQMGVSPFTVYSQQTFTIGTTWQEYTFTLTLPAADANAMLAFNLAQEKGQVWIDQVEMTTP